MQVSHVIGLSSDNWRLREARAYATAHRVSPAEAMAVLGYWPASAVPSAEQLAARAKARAALQGEKQSAQQAVAARAVALFNMAAGANAALAPSAFFSPKAVNSTTTSARTAGPKANEHAAAAARAVALFNEASANAVAQVRTASDTDAGRTGVDTDATAAEARAVALFNQQTNPSSGANDD